ncbi:Uu.00g051900.m01.CDS01 [Anthostomella pinea]|uniref:Uu.00g051900.m01.CDS01 n=1 Tax=Anthostomella pinea TaxID=933095 RepID=A0AAI8VWS2_9PEZI|nr:Uu.00g051900.m01.CDS01 [Anthostomella pinea]
MEDKASQGCFTAHFKHRNVELTEDKIDDMVEVTGQGRLGILLQHCTITGIAHDGYMDPEETEDFSWMLTQAFYNLKRRSSSGGLVSLCLRVAARIEGPGEVLVEPTEFSNWRNVQTVAERTFNITMGALRKSGLRVDEELDIYYGLQGCGLACIPFLRFVSKAKLKRNFGTLKILKVSMSAPHDYEAGMAMMGQTLQQS